MGVSAYSSLVVGIRFTIKTSEIRQDFTRFDPKTGQPFTFDEDVLEITISAGGKEIVLPKETVSARDEAKNSYFSNWNSGRQRDRIYQWLQSLGLECDDETKLSYFYRSYENQFVVGRLIGNGSSWDSSRSIAEIDLTKNNISKMQDELHFIFPDLNVDLVRYYLITQLS